ncbi:cytochrome P450 2J2-like [Lampris incognitus]|uniref:cytochrome P450 2J2-like n=1 Tax=Lampris incognitus TaxID=2546036 RepID=UPI0024B4D072|nr:cytochrome P450 2J2-like [Lampris incognitus]
MYWFVSMFLSPLWHWVDIRSMLLFTIVFLVIVDYARNRRPNSFPPGPMVLPFVGNIFSADLRKNEHMLLLAEKYGQVYSLRLGQEWIVMLNGFKTVKDVLVNQGDSFSDRPLLPILDEVAFKQGIANTNGHMWKQQRRFALLTLKHFINRKSFEDAIAEEIAYLLKEIADRKGNPFDPHIFIKTTVSNIISSLVFGHRFEVNDEGFLTLLRGLDQIFYILNSAWAQLYNSFPMLMRQLPGPHQTIQTVYKDTMDFIRAEINKHKEDWDPSEPRDYIDYYLNEIQKSKGIATGEMTFYEENLVICVLDLFFAGSETTASTLRWALLYMTQYPEVQEKLQAEIDQVIGPSRRPTILDRGNLPYTNAVIHEIQRMGNVVPLNIPHATTRDIQLGEYTIPKGIIVLPNLTTVLYDKNEWETPFTFNPGHFLNEDGEFVKPAAFLPFSAGKRACLGENLARMELFLFFTSLMQMFTFSMPAGVKPVFDYCCGVTQAPVNYEICANLR